MNKWFKYILISTIAMFIGFNSVGAVEKSCFIDYTGSYKWMNKGTSIGTAGIFAEAPDVKKSDCKGYVVLNCTYKLDNGNTTWTFKQTSSGKTSLTSNTGTSASSSISGLYHYICTDKIYYTSRDCDNNHRKGWYSSLPDGCSATKTYSKTSAESESTAKTYKALNCKYYSTSGGKITIKQNNTGGVTLYDVNNNPQTIDLSKLSACPDTVYYLTSKTKWKTTKPAKSDGTYVKYCYNTKCTSNNKDDSTTSKKDSSSIDTTKATEDYADSCDDAGETIKLLKQIYNLLRYLIPVLIIGLSIVDFIKVVATGEDKVFKEVWTKFVKRIVIGIVILILPAILSLIINLSGITDTYGIDPNNIFCILK